MSSFVLADRLGLPSCSTTCKPCTHSMTQHANRRFLPLHYVRLTHLDDALHHDVRVEY